MDRASYQAAGCYSPPREAGGIDTRKDGTTERSSRTETGLVAALAAALLVWFAGLFVIGGFGFPVGPDAPVYLWWTRLAGAEGLSAVERPGIPALALVLQGTLHLPLVAVTAALESVFGIGVGLSAAALLRAGGRGRAAWILAGALAGTFAVHLAAGYLANLAFAALFLAAAAALAEGTDRAAVVATGLLAASGFAHPLFFLLGVLILVAGALLAWQADRGEVRRVSASALGGVVALGAGMLALRAGPGPPAVDTSKDAFLRRAGLTADLRSAYLDRFVHHWTRYVQWASVPLAVYGLLSTLGFVGRFLLAWGVAFVAGAILGIATGAFPADRFITFGYVVPILAGIGVVRLWSATRRRPVVAAALASGLVAAMLGGALLTWARQRPFIDAAEVARLTEAGRYAAATAPGTPLLFRVDSGGAATTFLATQAANVIRAALPPDRIRDAFVIVPPYAGAEPLSPNEARQRRALVDLYEHDARGALQGNGGRGLLFQLAPFDRPGFGATEGCPQLGCSATGGPLVEVAPGVRVGADHPAPEPEPVAPLRTSSPGGVVVATLGVLGLLSAVGYGWARAAGIDLPNAVALSPLAGAGASILAGVALERLGVPLTGWIGPTSVSALAGGGGYAVRLILQRRVHA
ncbi:MAG TPA: hypothetical protein VF984_15045 [Actinomycetota bacterium]